MQNFAAWDSFITRYNLFTVITMTNSKTPNEEIVETLKKLITAFEQNNPQGMQKHFSRDIEIHVRELDLCGPAAFFNIYKPEKLTLSDFSVRASGDCGWGYGTVLHKKNIMHFSAVFLENKRHEWKLVHLHLSDASL